MRRQKHELAVGSLCKQRLKGRQPSRWDNPNAVLRIAKRLRFGKYFVVALGDPPGYGSWLDQDELRPLTPLEQLAMQAE